ncbi:hypothetical protein LIER_30713 [Lithospermum erythrorhizon]|uniref:Uncharacterized protein n=1 Tax=Lithospermum erythrorhizon TaxID=34254 RepID=A0AAV3RSB8_LITER
MEAGSSSKRVEEAPDRNVCILQVLEEISRKGKPHEDVRSVPFDEKDPAKVFKIGTTLGTEHEEMLIRLLQEHPDIFAWELKDIPVIDLVVAVHRLYVDPHYKPIKYKKRTFS